MISISCTLSSATMVILLYIITEGDNMVQVVGDDITDMDSSEHNDVSNHDSNSPLCTIPTPNSAPSSDCESVIESRPTRTTRRPPIIESDSASGGEASNGDVIAFVGARRTQGARLVGRQAGGAGAANRLPSLTSAIEKFERMISREQREVRPTEPLPEECK